MAKEKGEKAPKAPKASQKPKAVPAIRTKKPGDASKDIIGITVSKEENFSQWYQEIVIKAEMVEYYNEISGFYILRRELHTWLCLSRALI
jgi:prolyl-tRNA synthetase